MLSARMVFYQNKAKDNNFDDNVDFVVGNVKLITTKEVWDQYLEEARREGKIRLRGAIQCFIINLLHRVGLEMVRATRPNPHLGNRVETILDDLAPKWHRNKRNHRGGWRASPAPLVHGIATRGRHGDDGDESGTEVAHGGAMLASSKIRRRKKKKIEEKDDRMRKHQEKNDIIMYKSRL
ncbi:hypothetical protein JHK82_048271 [Glycine max]|nr:hypothetical protein JHK82_048271 [Glycine max]